VPTIVPPIPRADASAAQFEALRSLFRLAGWNEETTCDRLEIPNLAGVQPEAVRSNDSGPLESASDALVKLFIEGWPLPRGEAERWLNADGVALLEGFQLLMAHGSNDVAATVSLYPIEDLYVASDRYNNADGSLYDGWDDLVYPCLFVTTRKFIQNVPRTPCGEVLDLCAGTGIGALLAAPQAQRVLAADLTPRCDLFMQFNARLNGFSNIETATGDLYAAAGGRKFDRIIVHPPYQPVLEHIAVFNSGGFDGEQITRRIIEGAPAHLNPGGQLYCLCQLTDREYPVEYRVRQWITEAESRACDVAFVVYKHHDVSRYTASETLQEKKTYAAWQAWMRAFTDAGVRDMVYGMVVLQHAAEQRDVFTVRREGPESEAADIPALAAWETRASQPGFADFAMNSHPKAREGSSMFVEHELTPSGWKQNSLRLGRSSPFEVRIEIDPVTANLLAQMDGSKSGQQLKDSLPFAVPPEQMAALLRMLVSNGFVELI
jgi:SAM-dependent methyltransferase